jgi:hypothetical protein
MDLHFTAGPPTQVERDALDGVAPDEVAGRRDLLLPALHAVADAVGWISPEAIDEIGRRLHVAPAEVYGVASFYSSFTFAPAPTRVRSARARAREHRRHAVRRESLSRAVRTGSRIAGHGQRSGSGACCRRRWGVSGTPRAAGG